MSQIRSDLNIKDRTVEVSGANLPDIEYGNEFLDYAKSISSNNKIDKLDFIKI